MQVRSSNTLSLLNLSQTSLIRANAMSQLLIAFVCIFVNNNDVSFPIFPWFWRSDCCDCTQMNAFIVSIICWLRSRTMSSAVFVRLWILSSFSAIIDRRFFNSESFSFNLFSHSFLFSFLLTISNNLLSRFIYTLSSIDRVPFLALLV